MEKNVQINHLPQHIDQEVLLQGWLYNKRSSGKIMFLILRDGTGFVQGVLVKKENPELWSIATNLTQESALQVQGMVQAEPRSSGGVEIQITQLKILGTAMDYPITLKEHGVDFLAEHRHLWLRTPKQNAILRIRSEIEQALRDFFYQRDFCLTDAPIITPAACEGTTNLFHLDYHGNSAYLSQSGQLYIEATAMAMGKVYCLGPTFRAEKSKTRRHLMEFWMLEAEMAFYDLEASMLLQEEMLTAVVQRVLERCPEELKRLNRDTHKLAKIQAPFPRISYTEAVNILQQKGFAFTWGDDFGAPEETAISEDFDLPVFIHRYPVEIKAFYMQPDPEDPQVVLGADLIAPEGYGEIIGGGQRIDDLELLEQRLREHHLPRENFEWYLDLRRFGSIPHAGFGLGLERTVAWICGLEHIRETIPFPRMLYRMQP